MGIRITTRRATVILILILDAVEPGVAAPMPRGMESWQAPIGAASDGEGYVGSAPG